MKDKIKAIITDKIGIDFDDYEGENLTDDLGFDSLDRIELIMCIEREYDISINDDDAFRWETIDDIVKTVQEYLEAKK